jgi:hypothetical protein
MTKILFLDFDGVLNPTLYALFLERLNRLSKYTTATDDQYGQYFAPYATDNLRILIQETGGKIVFTSNWRKDVDLKKMWTYRYNFGEVIGCTPCLENNNRGDEIDLWLNKNDIDRYVILDDMLASQFHGHQLKYLVTCNSVLGFTDKELEQAINILK